ncbi:MAG: SH3 domain-containing protein [Treponemataceae bacterium]|nr:MAG: SH3 domain-containing protein [Treponemataceae bacterium]
MVSTLYRETREKKLLFFCVLGGFVFLFLSCSSKLGYSVVLWNIPEYGLEDGDIVRVYFKSNITNTYAIGLPSDDKQKVEIPAWQLSAPSSRGNAVRTARRFAEYKNQYASVALDGLPIRSEPINTARQVYRLKKNEVIKVLYKETGQAVMIGNTPTEGDWLRVVTSDGTQGWCFSFNLCLFDSRDTESLGGQSAETQSADDTVLEEILSRVWYPEIYESLILSNTIDLTRINSDYGFSINQENQTVKIRLPEFEKDGAYTEIIKQTDGSYDFLGSSVYVIHRQPGLIVVTVTDERGMPTANNFIAVDETVDSIISAEKARRARLLRAIISLGPVFSSANYGTLQFSEDNSFYWQDFRLLTPLIIPSGAANSGAVEFKYFLSRQLASEFDGVITFNFESAEDEVNFFYKIESGGLRLEDVSGAVIRENVFISRGNSPIVAFFARQ